MLALWLATPSAWSQSDHSLDTALHQLLEHRCAECHGLHATKFEKPKKPQLDLQTDLAALRSNPEYIVPANAAGSPLFEKVISTNDEERMPETTEKNPRDPLNKEEIALLRQWIEQAPPPTNKFIADSAVLNSIYHDLFSHPAPERSNFRYLTLHNLANAGDSGEKLEIYRVALNKLVNSLSSRADILNLEPINASKTVLRLDLRHYGWQPATWEFVARGYPHAVLRGVRLEDFIARMSGCEVSFVRGDWFAFAASQAPLYHDILGMPATERELERLLNLNVEANIRNGTAQRAGFAKSGVANFNRLIERHPQPFGAYWKSYDFAGDKGLRDLFEHPLGPVAMAYRFGFQHNGGEIIWNLPNGLQAYLLVNAQGQRLNRAPLEIVADPNQPDRAVLNGISCMGCHFAGIRQGKHGNLADEVRPAALNALDLNRQEADYMRRLYPEPGAFQRLAKDDEARFRAALVRVGVSEPRPEEPITILYNRFLQDITLEHLNSEFGLVPNVNLLGRLQDSSNEHLRVLGSRLRAAGSLPRKGFAGEFRLIAETLPIFRVRTNAQIRYEAFYPTTPVAQTPGRARP